MIYIEEIIEPQTERRGEKEGLKPSKGNLCLMNHRQGHGTIM